MTPRSCKHRGPSLGDALAGEWLVAPEGWLFPGQHHHRASQMGCSLQPGVNRAAATAIVSSLPLVISPLRRWGDHFQANGAIPGTVERRQILHDKLPPGAGRHSLPALHRYHAHRSLPAPPRARGRPHFCIHVSAIPGRISSNPPPRYSREVAIGVHATRPQCHVEGEVAHHSPGPPWGGGGHLTLQQSHPAAQGSPPLAPSMKAAVTSQGQLTLVFSPSLLTWSQLIHPPRRKAVPLPSSLLPRVSPRS